MLVFKRLGWIAAVVCWTGAVLVAQEGPQVYRQKDRGVVAPTPVKRVNANYTDAARENRIQGIVQLDGVVLEDGTVGGVTVTKSLDKTYGLDDAAVAALKQWLFNPGQRDGKPVRVMVTVEFSFTLK